VLATWRKGHGVDRRIMCFGCRMRLDTRRAGIPPVVSAYEPNMAPSIVRLVTASLTEAAVCRR
jgi:hypothetical protein